MALGFASAFGRTHGLARVVPLIGAWIIVAPWAVSGNVNTTAVVVSNVLVGGVLVLLGLVTLFLGMRRGGAGRQR